MSATVIVYTQRMDFRMLLEIECKSLTGQAPVIKDSIEDLLSFLSLCADVDILVLDDPHEDLTPFLPLESRARHVLILSSAAPNPGHGTFFPTGAVEELFKKLKGLLETKSTTQEGYISIPIDSFLHFKILPFDLFIKIAEGKYLKRIPANEEIDELTITAFKSKGLTEMHFERKHNRDFSMMLLNNMINKVESEYSTDAAKFKATNEVFLTTQEIVQSLGLPPRVIQVCESVMDRITSDVTANKDKFSNYITGMQSAMNLSFQFRFIQLSSFIATQIVDAINDGAKADQIKTIVFASFFCDISLKDPKYLEFRTDESLKDLWEEDRKLIVDHALRSSEVILKYKNAPPMAGDIIKQHHGSIDGRGFAPQISETLLPLAKCLIAAQELAFGILKNPSVSVNDVVALVSKKYAGTTIHPHLKLFADSTVNKN